MRQFFKKAIMHAAILAAIGITLFGIKYALAFTPGTPEAYFENSIVALGNRIDEVIARITVLENAPKPTATITDDIKQRITTLETQNTYLTTRLDELTQRVARNEGQTVQTTQPAPIVQTITQVQPSDYGTRISTLEARVKVLDMITSMADVTVGSHYSRVDQLVAPLYKKLGIKQ